MGRDVKTLMGCRAAIPQVIFPTCNLATFSAVVSWLVERGRGDSWDVAQRPLGSTIHPLVLRHTSNDQVNHLSDLDISLYSCCSQIPLFAYAGFFRMV